jgi:hypothetical protein
LHLLDIDVSRKSRRSLVPYQCVIIHLLSQVSNNQTVIAATANTLVLVKDLAPKRVGMEALDVPGEAEDAPASSIKSSVGGSLGVEDGWLVVKLPIHSLRPVSSACS